MNTTITRDVVIDLLPLYQGGELSGDSRRIVEAFLAQDAELAKLVEKLGFDSAELRPLKPEHELATFNRTRHLRYQFNAFFLLGLIFTLLWFGVAVASAIVPLANGAAIGVPLFFVAAFFWVGLGNVSWQLSKLD